MTAMKTIFVDVALQELETFPEVDLLKRTKGDGPESHWYYLQDTIRDILMGEWNIDFPTAEMGAAWMLIYVMAELKSSEWPIMMMWGDGNLTLSVNVLGDQYMRFDFEDVIRREIECDDESDDTIKHIKEYLDRIQLKILKEKTTKQDDGKIAADQEPGST